MKLYNSLTKKVEEFNPIDSKTVRMYSCGPTVYYYPHIGNMRAYIFMDSLRRILKYNGYSINGVMNITDVGHLTSDSDTGDDKMEISAKKENKSPYEIAEYYTNIFFDNLSKLNVDVPEHVTKATEYIDKMITFIKVLEEKGYTYIISDGVYFDVSKFKDYGRLSNKNMDEIGYARIEENSEKRNPYDFALWKFVAENHIMKWDSPWGVGCPGWHIECSTMSTDILGDNIDIHTGGIDHKTVHHENEIAQNDAFSGHRVVDSWMHCNFLLVDGGKMSKSLNNIYTIDELITKGYDSLDFKYFCLNAHYSKNINFTFEGMDAAHISLIKIKNILAKHKNSGNEEMPSDIDLEKCKQDFLDAINDDLNTPLALGVLWTMIKSNPNVNVYKTALEFDKALGLKLDEEVKEEKVEVPTEVEELVKQRSDAKKDKDFALADKIRNQITELGYEVKDTREGVVINKI